MTVGQPDCPTLKHPPVPRVYFLKTSETSAHLSGFTEQHQLWEHRENPTQTSSMTGLDCMNCASVKQRKDRWRDISDTATDFAENLFFDISYHTKHFLLDLFQIKRLFEMR